MLLTVPELSLVVLIGPSGAGKSTFAARHFRPTEVVSSDFCRGLVADDESDMAASPAAFRVLNLIVAERLRAGRLTVVDATSVQREARASLLELARDHDCVPVAVVFNLPESVCQERNRGRTDRRTPASAVHRHFEQMRRSLGGLAGEGFRHIHVLDSPQAMDEATIDRQRMWVDRRDERGPFDIIGDVHGCSDELRRLLASLGHMVAEGVEGDISVTHPEGRRLVFLGDLVNRGPDVPGVLRLVMAAVRDGALCVAGNHDQRLARALRGGPLKEAVVDMEASLKQLKADPACREAAIPFLDDLLSHYVLDRGRLVVAHAGLAERYHGRASARVRELALFGQPTGERDDDGNPVRADWARDYRGRAAVVYGHFAVAEPRWVNGTVNIDTGCVFGGRLTALRYPERELVSVPAARVYFARVGAAS